MIPLAVFAATVPFAVGREAEDTMTAEPSDVTVGLREQDFRASVSVELTLAEPVVIRVAGSGVVTSVSVTSGGGLASGDRLLELDYVPVLALVSTSPLIRDLELGDSGPDVAVVARFLSELGLLPPGEASRTIFDRSMRTAVQNLQDRLAVRRDGIFRQSYVAFVPDNVRSVGAVSATVGETLGPGGELFRAGPTPVAATISASDGRSLDPRLGEDLVFQAGEQRTPVSSTTVTGDELAVLATALAEAELEGRLTATADPDSGRVDYSGGFLARAEPVRIGTVPSTAVLLAGETSCIFVVAGEADPSPLRVTGAEVPVNELGIVAVDPSLSGTRIVRDVTLLSDRVRATCR